jgi:hypothetical protein
VWGVPTQAHRTRVSYAAVEASDDGDGRAADGRVVSVISIHTARYGNTTIGDATVLGQSGDRAGRYVPDRLHRCEQTERMSRESPAGGIRCWCRGECVSGLAFNGAAPHNPRLSPARNRRQSRPIITMGRQWIAFLVFRLHNSH